MCNKSSYDEDRGCFIFAIIFFSFIFLLHVFNIILGLLRDIYVS